MKVNKYLSRIKTTKIPDGWNIKKLNDIFLIRTGTTPSTKREDYWKDGTINWITPEDMGKLSGIRLIESNRKITDKALRETNLSVMPKGSIIISSRAPVGYVAVVESETTFNQGCKGLIPKDDSVSTIFYCYYLVSKKHYLNRLSNGSTFVELSKSTLEVLDVVYPPIREQRRIADILTNVDEAIGETDNIVKACERIKKGLMQTLLIKGLHGRHNKFKKTEIGEIPQDWDLVGLGKHVKKLIVPMRDKPKRFSGTIPWCRIEDFDGKYLFTSKSGQFVDAEIIKEMNLKVFPKDTVICSCSASLGICAISGRELVTNQTFIGIVPNDSFNVEFLYYLMSSYAKRLQSLSSGTTIAYLSREEFEKFEVVKPPKDEQNRIVALLTAVDDRICSENQKKSQLELLKKGLMQVLLTGKVRVKVD